VSDQCCCQWGAAIGNRTRRGLGPSGEVPEFPCVDCPVPGHDLMSTGTERCRRHRKCCCLGPAFRCADCYLHHEESYYGERCQSHRQRHLAKETT